ncbi:hypothetical protein C8R47DRAFT_141846 [Mycena vitilis]|nr:hypothetical protein C8R47DRAFT_141846 [Mycena vitilis]
MPPPIEAPLYPLSILSSNFLGAFFSFSYVASLYVAQNTNLRFPAASDVRLRVQRGRDDPAVIRARLTGVAIASLLNCCVVYLLAAQSALPSFNRFAATLSLLGVRWPGSILALLQTPVLFLGPIYGSYLGRTLPGQAKYSVQHDLIDVFGTWIGFRNYIWGPFTEEVVFRSCILSAYAMGGATRWKMIVFAPFAFGLAHVHHAWEVYTRCGRTKDALRYATMSCLFQTAYTTLFGVYASFLFLRTSSLLPPLTAHIFCNIMGLPDIHGEMERLPEHKHRIIAAYALGIISFIATLQSWTETQTSLYWRAPEAFWPVVL